MQEIIKRMQNRIMQQQKQKGFETIFDFLNEDLDEMQQQLKKWNLQNVSGSLPAVNTTKIIKEQYDFEGLIDIVQCCKIGPITNENYCPNCGKKILRQ